MRLRRPFVPLALFLLFSTGELDAQQPSLPQALPPPQPATTLGELQRAAVAMDPRSRQRQLLEAQTALRERSVQATRLPSLSLDALAQHQSDVPEAALRLPSGEPAFAGPHTTTDLSARVEQRLIDPARQGQIALEQARRDERLAAVDTALFSLKRQVREAFFAAYGIRERIGVLDIAFTRLLRNRDDAQNRLIAGTAVPADVAQADAALLDLRQETESLTSRLRGVMQQIEMLAGRPMRLENTLAMPDARETIVRSLGAAGARTRPEFAQFAGAQARLSREIDLVDAAQRPRLSAFSRVGYGRPGLNFAADRFDVYGIVGLQVQWRPLTWGSAAREREGLRLQQEIVKADEEAFMNTLQASMPGYIYPIERLEQAMADDDRIVTLREQVEQTASVRLRAGVITMSEYLAINAELRQAQNARAARRIELAQKAAEMLEAAGVEMP
ncbi:MAG: TolC family protein [Vicinamibacterales bacterium]